MSSVVLSTTNGSALQPRMPEYTFPGEALAYGVAAVAIPALALVAVTSIGMTLGTVTVVSLSLLAAGAFVKKAHSAYQRNRGEAEFALAGKLLGEGDRRTAMHWYGVAGIEHNYRQGKRALHQEYQEALKLSTQEKFERMIFLADAGHQLADVLLGLEYRKRDTKFVFNTQKLIQEIHSVKHIQDPTEKHQKIAEKLEIFLGHFYNAFSDFPEVCQLSFLMEKVKNLLSHDDFKWACEWGNKQDLPNIQRLINSISEQHSK